MTDFRSLKILDVFRGAFTRFGIEYDVMRKIIQVKLTMDRRRIPTIFNSSKVKEDANHFLKSLLMYVFFGLILVPFTLLGDHYLIQMGLSFGVIMFLLMTTMVSDFSSVMLDVRDKNILQTKPVNKRTISAAKTIHVLIYLFLITAALVAIPAVVGLVRHGIIFTVLFLVELVLIGLLVVVITALVYLFILRFFNGERLKDIINYVQILLSVSIFIGYQVLARSFELVNLDIVFNFSWWHILLPPLWFSAPFELFLNNDYSNHVIVMSLLALIVPIILIITYVRSMSLFEENLQKLMSDSNRRKKRVNRVDDFWSKILCRNKEEKVFFHFASHMMKLEREFKLKVYPSLGFSILLPLLFIFNETRMSSFSFAELQDGKMYLFIYFCNMMIPTIIYMLQFSGSYKGSWIYRVTPIQKESTIYSATLKAFIVKLYLPVFLVISIIFIWIFSLRIVPDVFAVLLGAILQTVWTYKLVTDETYPFAMPFSSSQSGNSMKMFLVTLLTGIFVAAHLIALSVPFGIYGYIVILLGAIFFVWRKVFR